MLIFLNVIDPTNLTNLSDLTSEFRETSTELDELHALTTLKSNGIWNWNSVE